MDRDKRISIGLTPFLYEWEELLMDGERHVFLGLSLGFAYFEKLTCGDVDIPFPNMVFPKGNINSRVFYELIEWAGDVMMASMIDWSSFGMEVIDLSNLEGVTNLDWEIWLQMGNTTRNKEISDYQDDLFTKSQMRLFRQMPEPVLNSIDLQYNRSVIYLFSKKLAKYLWFADQNQQIIDNQFSKEHRQIQNALSLLRYPTNMESAEIQIKKTCYIIGFYFGDDLDTSISSKDLNWNFFVALYVLEKLLSLADDLFGFYKKR